jgi:hypothetical protein
VGKVSGSTDQPLFVHSGNSLPFFSLPLSLNLPQITIQPIEGLLDEVVSGKTDVLEGSKGNRTHVVAKSILLSRAILCGFLSYDWQTGSWLTEATANSAHDRAVAETCLWRIDTITDSGRVRCESKALHTL